MTEKAYQICSSWDKDVLKIVIAGTLLRADANAIAESVGEIFDRRKPAKVLIDCTDLDGRLGVVDTFFHVREHKISLIPIPTQSALFVGSLKAPQRTICTPPSPSSSPP